METLIYVLLYSLFNKTANIAERSRPRQVQALTCKAHLYENTENHYQIIKLCWVILSIN